MGRSDVCGSKFSLFTEIHIHFENVTFPALQSVEVYSKVFVFLEMCYMNTTSCLNSTVLSSVDLCSVGWYTSENVKFRLSDTFLCFQKLSYFEDFCWVDSHYLQNIDVLEYEENDNATFPTHFVSGFLLFWCLLGDFLLACNLFPLFYIPDCPSPLAISSSSPV